MNEAPLPKAYRHNTAAINMRITARLTRSIPASRRIPRRSNSFCPGGEMMTQSNSPRCMAEKLAPNAAMSGLPFRTGR
jgi:hypothetical protein